MWRATRVLANRSAGLCGRRSREFGTSREVAAPIERIAIIGSGLMGSGIAQVWCGVAACPSPFLWITLLYPRF